MIFSKEAQFWRHFCVLTLSKRGNVEFWFFLLFLMRVLHDSIQKEEKRRLETCWMAFWDWNPSKIQENNVKVKRDEWETDNNDRRKGRRGRDPYAFNFYIWQINLNGDGGRAAIVVEAEAMIWWLTPQIIMVWSNFFGIVFFLIFF